MTILHIAKIRNTFASGVSVAVPEHVRAQSEFATVGLVNFLDYKPNGIKNAFTAANGFSLDKLPAPFNKPDIAVFHEVYRPEYVKAARALKKARVPYVIVPHGCLTKTAQKIKRVKKILGNIFFHKFLKNAVAFQCLSERETENFVFKGYKKFIGLNGTNIAAVPKSDFHADGVKFVYIGRLTPHIKGIDLLLDAISAQKEYLARENCRFDLYGPKTGGDEDFINTEIEKKGLSQLVCLHDKVCGKEKEKVLFGSDVFVQTSRSEGLPLGVLEALGYGLPVLVTVGTGVTEMVSAYGAGITCETSAEGIANALKTAVAEKKNFNAMGVAATRLARENFDWKAVAAKTVDDYGKIVRGEFTAWRE